MRTSVRVTVALAILAALALAATVVLRLPPPAGDGLAGPVWRWTATIPAGNAASSPVPDPSAYTVEFGPGRIVRATADCTEMTGRYRVIPPGRKGPLPGLVITPGPGGTDPCGAGSLAEAFTSDLARAGNYRIADGSLTIYLVDGGAMAFR